ncbi:CopG family transcriptional regulator [Streptomyces sp. NPDC058739]|uniref:CopG family transcriptional regulator n=1 Tax=Streptomyces sp. NPDC058739 TaxID=3346618 RepID=UPI0036C3D861
MVSRNTPRDIAEAAKVRSGLSALTLHMAAVTREIERDHLNELITAAEAEHGPVSYEEIQCRRDQLTQARREETGQ